MAKFKNVQIRVGDNPSIESGVYGTRIAPFVEDSATLIDFSENALAGKKVYAKAMFVAEEVSDSSEWSELRSFTISPLPKPSTNGPDTAISGWTFTSDPNKEVPSHPDKPWTPNFKHYDSEIPYNTYLNPLMDYNKYKFDVNTVDSTNMLPYKTGINTPFISRRSNRILKNTDSTAKKFTNLTTPTLSITGIDTERYLFSFPERQFNIFGKSIGCGSAFYNPLDSNVNKRNAILNKNINSSCDYSVSLADTNTRFNAPMETIAAYPATIPVPYTTATGNLTINDSNIELKDVGFTGALYFSVRYSDPRCKVDKYRTTTFPGKDPDNDTVYTSVDYNNANSSYSIRDAIQYPGLPTETDLKHLFPATQHNRLSGAFAPTEIERNIRLTPFPDLILKGVNNKFVVDGELNEGYSNPFTIVTVATSNPLVKLYLSSNGVSTASESVTFNFNDKPEITLITNDNPSFINALYLRVSFYKYPTSVTTGNPAKSSIKIYKLRPVINQLGYSSHFQDEIDYLPCVYLVGSMTHREAFDRVNNTNNVKFRGTTFGYEFSNVAKATINKLRLTSQFKITDNDNVNDIGETNPISYFSSFNIVSGYDNLNTLRSNTSQPIPQIGYTKERRLSSDYSIPVIHFGNFNQYQSDFIGVNTLKAMGGSETLYRKFNINNKDMGVIENIDRVGGIDTTGWASYRLSPIPSLDNGLKRELVSPPIDCQVIPLILENGANNTDKKRKYTYLATIDGQAMHIITDTTLLKNK